MDSPAWDKLKKILRLEQSKGYRDEAVIGGLAKFVDLWQSEARAEADATAEEWVDEIATSLANYADKDEAERSEVVEQVLSRLEQTGIPCNERTSSPGRKVSAPSDMHSARRRLGLARLRASHAPVESLPGISSGLAPLRKLGIARWPISFITAGTGTTTIGLSNRSVAWSMGKK